MHRDNRSHHVVASDCMVRGLHTTRNSCCDHAAVSSRITAIPQRSRSGSVGVRRRSGRRRLSAFLALLDNHVAG